tara:strand:- start:739 stop:1104 length:366 start_codon:yes stop_codon:yes gene_type:complete
MWQLKKLSTNEALSEAGPLPNNWGPIFGLHGFQEKLGDLAWLGPSYADQGWVELSLEEQEAIATAKVMAEVQTLKAEAIEKLSDKAITVENKAAWNTYLLALDSVCLCVDFSTNPTFPVKP